MVVATIGITLLALLVLGVIKWFENTTKTEKIFCAKIALLVAFCISAAVFLASVFIILF